MFVFLRNLELMKKSFVKISFSGEWMWVAVMRVSASELIGRLSNDPVVNPKLRFGDIIRASFVDQDEYGFWKFEKRLLREMS